MSALRQTVPFNSLEESQQLLIANYMAPLTVADGEALTREGEEGDRAFLLESGKLNVRVGDEDRGNVQPGQIVGELALIYNVPRTATVTATGEAHVFVLIRSGFQSTLREENIARRRDIFTFLRSCHAFQKLGSRDLSRLADVVETQRFVEGNTIVREGEQATGMYFINEGQVVVKQSVPGEEAERGERTDRIINYVKTGDYFGERALLTDDPRSASVEAATDVVCLFVGREAFLKLLDPLHDELMSKMPQRPAHLAVHVPGSGDNFGGRGAARTAGGHAYARPANFRYEPKKEGLVVVKPLGAGGFACVMMVRDKQTRLLYALKVVNKRKLVATNGAQRTASLLHEKQALEELCHPFVLSLVASYQDPLNLYLLIDLALGGELFRVMDELERLPEPTARYYTGALTLALQHIHSMDFVYRDLKPENVLLDKHGFIKVCDFGFAKKVSDRTYTQCGTPDYVSPEMLMGQGVNQACDWWALGVLLFEMLAGVPPFTDPDGKDLQTFANILKGEVRFPSPGEADFCNNFPAPVRSLISGLLTVKITERLGYVKGGAEDILAHAWFGGLAWDAMINRTLAPPWKPDLKSADDCSYFDEEGQQEALQAQLDESGSTPLTPEEDSEWSHVWQAFGGLPPSNSPANSSPSTVSPRFAAAPTPPPK